MNKVLLLLIGLSALFITGGFVAAWLSQRAPELGLQHGKLADCPQSPNCVSTENGRIGPILLEERDAGRVWADLQQVIRAQGGNIRNQTDDYLWATFKSSFFGFIDDLEARMDDENQAIQLRSASRVGYYDFNVNANRINKIKQKISAYYAKTTFENTL